MQSPFRRSTSRNLILIQQTSTQLTLQRGELRRNSKKILGLEPQVLGAIGFALIVGIFAIYRRNQTFFAGQTDPFVQWFPIFGPILIGAVSLASRLGTATHEVFTFDRASGNLLHEATSALGKRAKSYSLNQITDLELVEQPDDDVRSYSINLLLQSRKKITLGWGDRQITPKQQAIALHHYRTLAQQLRDFLLPQLVGQPLLDRTKGASLVVPLSAIEADQQANMDYAKELAGLMFGGKDAKQAHIEKIRQLLAQNPQDADANYKMAMALSLQKVTQYEALPYFQRARDGYRQNGDCENNLPMIEQSIRQLEKKRR
jgi:hypothetical protein